MSRNHPDMTKRVRQRTNPVAPVFVRHWFHRLGARGYCAFTIDLDSPISPAQLGGVEVRRVGDGAPLEATQACREKLAAGA